MEVSQGLLTPLEEGVAFHVSMILDVEVHVKSVAAGTRNIDLHRVVNHQIHGHLRVDLLGVPTHFHHGVAQRSQIHHGGNTGEVLEDDTRGSERNLAALTVGRPCGDLANVRFGDEEPIVSAQRAFKENTDRVRKVSRGNTVGIEGVKRVVIATDSEGLACVEGVQCRHDSTENPAVYEENPSPLRQG